MLSQCEAKPRINRTLLPTRAASGHHFWKSSHFMALEHAHVFLRKFNSILGHHKWVITPPHFPVVKPSWEKGGLHRRGHQILRTSTIGHIFGLDFENGRAQPADLLLENQKMPPSQEFVWKSGKDYKYTPPQKKTFSTSKNGNLPHDHPRKNTFCLGSFPWSFN